MTSATNKTAAALNAWAESFGVRFVNRSDGQRTTDTVSRDALMALAASHANPDKGENFNAGKDLASHADSEDAAEFGRKLSASLRETTDILLRAVGLLQAADLAAMRASPAPAVQAVAPDDVMVERAWARFEAELSGDSKVDRVHALVNAGPLPGMSEAFDAYMGAAAWTDPAYAPDASTWAAAWKAALAAAPVAQPLTPLTDRQISATYIAWDAKAGASLADLMREAVAEFCRVNGLTLAAAGQGQEGAKA